MEKDFLQTRNYSECLINNSVDMIVSVDIDRKIVVFNPAAEKTFGYTKEEVIGKHISMLYADPSQGLHVSKSVKNLGEFEEEILNRRKDGSIFIAQLSTAILHNEDGNVIGGNVIGVMGISRDITKLKQTENELINNYQYRAVLNTLLKISLENITLADLLEKALDTVLSTPCLPSKPKGAIFLVEDESEVLVMKVSKALSPSLLRMCAKVEFGRCLCGRAALNGTILHSECVDDRHENRYEGITPHGHYNVPIISEGQVIGLIVLYLDEGHERN